MTAETVKVLAPVDEEARALFRRLTGGDHGGMNELAPAPTPTPAPPDPFDSSIAEAIVVVDRERRPALIVRNNSFEQPTLATWKTLLNAHRIRLERAIRSVGRLELEGHPTLPYAGTAWMLGGKGIAITNRHVGELFARKQGSSFRFLNGAGGHPIRPKVDFREEFQVSVSQEIYVEKVLFISEPGDANPDVAIVRLASDVMMPDPIQLFDGTIEKGENVAVIGYPASDPRNPASALSTVFGDVFEVKRLSPGTVTQAVDGFTFQHDCSTLGGNSGSVVLDIATGKAIGLHFGGRFREANYAVSVERIKKILKSLKVQIAVPVEVETAKKAKKLETDYFEGRQGYDIQFLGRSSAHRVPLPVLKGEKAEDVTPVEGTRDNLLRYTHFSILMSASRKLCHFAAVNIDGETSFNIRRSGDKWNYDPRIPESAQAGNELYVDNDLDRGHMVRRLDPVWGEKDEGEQANNDTFVYTNSTPQHALLNQKTWNDLEDYILSNTQSHELKATVFTGPVLDPADPEYRGVQLPQQFWKVVTAVNGDKLHATAYILSQKDLITDLEFVFGQFRTYQLPIATLEEKTGLSFGKLSQFDPLKDQETFAIREISKVEEIVL